MLDTLTGGIGNAEVRFSAALEEQVLETAIQALDYARVNAPWQDRTGDARAELDTDVSWEGDEIVWTMYHGVDYGQWLETIKNGEFAIIMPTLEQFAPQVCAGGDLFSGDYGSSS